MFSNTDHLDILDLMKAYFEGLYHADSTMLRKVFHPKLAYICATEGDELYLDLDTYMDRIDQREAPAKRGEARNEAILELSVSGNRLAHVKARMSMLGRTYVDRQLYRRTNDEPRHSTIHNKPRKHDLRRHTGHRLPTPTNRRHHNDRRRKRHNHHHRPQHFRIQKHPRPYE